MMSKTNLKQQNERFKKKIIIVIEVALSSSRLSDNVESKQPQCSVIRTVLT